MRMPSSPWAGIPNHAVTDGTTPTGADRDPELMNAHHPGAESAVNGRCAPVAPQTVRLILPGQLGLEAHLTDPKYKNASLKTCISSYYG